MPQPIVVRSTESLKHLIAALQILAMDENVMISVKCSVTTGVITGVSSALGGGLMTPLGLAPVGLLVGAAIGSVTSAIFFHKKFKPLITIIDEMADEEKNKLANHVMDAVSKFNISDVYKVISLLEGSEGAIKWFIIEAMKDHFQMINS